MILVLEYHIIVTSRIDPVFELKKQLRCKKQAEKQVKKNKSVLIRRMIKICNVFVTL